MKIGLFIPCYVDALYPEVGVATMRLLRSLGLDVGYPERQTCCGQPMGNGGFERLAVPLAKKYDELFAPYDYVVAPSVSCTAFVRHHHPDLLKERQCEAAGKTTDLVAFLHDVLKVTSLPARFPHKVSVHNSCHGVRELGLSSPSERNEPRYNKIVDLLRLVEGIEVVEPERPDECCGFGGMFAVEERAVSARMGLEKVRRHIATGAEYVTGPDSSCLMHMKGVADKQGITGIKFVHVVQILAGEQRV